MFCRAIRLALGLTVAALGASPALAGTPSGADLAAACTACHGPAGRSGGAIPSLAGLAPERFTQRMRAYRNGQGTIMNRIAPAYGEAQTQALARYFAQQAPRPSSDDTR